MGIQFWCMLYDMKLFASSIQVLLWYDYDYELILYFMNCIFYDLSCIWSITFHYMILMTESVSFHKFVLVVPLILNFVFHFMSYKFLMVTWFSYIFDYIPIQFLFWFYWIIFFLKDFFKLEPLWSRFNFRDNIFWRCCRGWKKERISSPGKNDKD